MNVVKGIFYSVLVLIILLILAVGSFWYFSPTVVEGSTSLQRSTSTPIMWGFDPLPVTTTIDLASYVTCQQESAPLDIVVLIDASGSMGNMALNEPLGSAIRGAEAFISSLDLSIHQVAVGLFSQSVFSKNGLVSERDLLTATLANLDGRESGTSLAAPMSFAESELRSRRRRVGTLPIVLLFSDGGANDADTAIRTAESIKQLGGQVFVVGLRGEGFDETVLRALATSDATLRIAPTPAELSSLFQEIAQIVNSYVLQDVTYVEPIDTSRFEVIPGSLPDTLLATSGGLRFEAEAMTVQEVQAFSGFSYRVRPSQYGLADVTDGSGILSLEACGAPSVVSELPVGPKLLVLPPLPIAALIPLALLLLAALPMMFMGRKKPSGISPPTIPVDLPRTPSPPSDNIFVAWLNRVENLEHEDIKQARNLLNTPTLIIGLGRTGQVVLHQISERVQDYVGNNWPDTIGLVHLAFPKVEGSLDPKFELPDYVQKVSFTRDIDRQIQDQPYVAWARGGMGGPRVKGRMSLFTDLSGGKGNSNLWKALANAIDRKTGIRVWIVADGFGPGSGVISDLAHLVRVVPNAANIIDSVRLCLVMQHSNWGRGVASSGIDERCYATLREIQRMQLSNNSEFVYTSLLNQQELRATHSGKMFDEIYLFDGVGESKNDKAYDISRLAPEKGVLKVISNAMMGLLDGGMSSEFYFREKNTQANVAKSGRSDLENYGSVMGCAVYRVPFGATRRLVELRLLHHLLFDPSDGLWGWGTVDELGHQTASPYFQIPSVADGLANFKADISTNSGGTLAGIDFQQRLQSFLVARMNSDRRLGLRWADKFLAELAVAHPSESSINRYHAQVKLWLDLVGQSQQNTPQQSGDSGFMDLEGSDNPFLSFSFDEAQREIPYSKPAIRQLRNDDSLVEVWAKHWQQKYDSFPTTESDEPEQLAWTIDDVADIYRRAIGDEAAKLLRMRQRVFWYWSSHTQPELRILILPNDLAASHPQKGGTLRDDVRNYPHDYTFGPEDSDLLLRKLLVAARPFSLAVHEHSDLANTRLTDTSVQNLVDHNASPLAKITVRGQDTVVSEHTRYLLLPPSMSNDLSRVDADVRVMGTDSTACTLLHVRHVVRLDRMYAYSEARQAYQPDPTLFVLAPEQDAARRERIARRWGGRDQTLTMSPSAVALLDGHSVIVDSVGKLFYNGSFKLAERGDGWQVLTERSGLLQMDGQQATAFLLGIVQYCSDNPDFRSRLMELADERTTTYEITDKLEEQISVLAKASDADLRDLAIVIACALD